MVGWDASLESRGTWGSILMEALAVRFSVFQAKDVTTFSQRLLLSCEIVIRSSLLPVVHRWIMMQKVRHFGDNQHAQWSSSSYLALHMWVTRSSCQQCSTPWRRQDDIWQLFFTGFERAVEDDCSFSSPERHGIQLIDWRFSSHLQHWSPSKERRDSPREWKVKSWDVVAFLFFYMYCDRFYLVSTASK